VAKRKQETYGYTAEQLLDRLKGAPSAPSLVAHLVKDTPSPEIERLLIDLLPVAYFTASEDPNAEPGYHGHLLVCYRSVFDLASDDIKTKVCKRLYELYRMEPETTVVLYEDNFFKTSDLRYLAPNEQDFIKTHLVGRINVGLLTEEMISSLEGIGSFLSTDEVDTFAFALLAVINRDNVKLASKAQTLLLSEYSSMSDACRSEVRADADFFDSETLRKLEQHETLRSSQAKSSASGAN